MRPTGTAGQRVDGLVVTVMPGPGQAPLIAALERLGCEVLSRPCQGVPLLRCDKAGFYLTVRDGLNSRHPTGVDALAAAVDWCSISGEKGPIGARFWAGEGGTAPYERTKKAVLFFGDVLY